MATYARGLTSQAVNLTHTTHWSECLMYYVANACSNRNLCNWRVYAGISSPIRPLSAIFARRTPMRQTRKSQLALGEARIEDIKLDHKSRDDIPAVLLGLQHLYSHEQTREKLFSVLEEHIVPGTNRNVGRPGMELWRILVMGVLKQGLGCDFDRLHELVNQHRTVREFLGHGAFSQGDTYELQTIIDNVYLLTPELLSEIGQLVVESGHAVARKKPGEPLRGRCDSFVVETDVHYPTDVKLLWDAMRCLLGELGRAARKHHIGGWRQWRHLTREVKKCFNKVRSTRRAKSRPDRVEAYLERCWHLVGRAEDSCRRSERQLQGAGAGRCCAIDHDSGSDCPCASANGPSRAASSQRRGDRAR